VSRSHDARRATTVLALVAVVLAASCSHGGHRSDAVRVVTPRSAPALLANLVPLYAVGRSTDHLVTTDPAERRAQQRRGWRLDATATSDCNGIVGYAYDRNVSWTGSGPVSTVPLYRFDDQRHGGYHYETIVGSAGQVRARIAHLDTEDIRNPVRLGFVFAQASRADGTALAHALRSYVDPTTHETYLSVDGHARPGFVQEAVVGYVTTGASLQRRTGNAHPGTQLCPLTLLTRSSASGATQYATTDLADRSHHLATGWRLDETAVGSGVDGIAGYLWSKSVPGTATVVRTFDAGVPTWRIAPAGGTPPASTGPTVLGHGFTAPQPRTFPLQAFTDTRGAWRYATTAPGSRAAVSDGFRPAVAPVQLLPDPDSGVPYFEVHGPGLAASKRAIILVHGGAWAGGVSAPFPVGQLPQHFGGDATQSGDGIDDMARRDAAAGWTVYTVDYHSGATRALRELRAFSAALTRSAPHAAVCTAGASAGGQLALMLAALDPHIRCVMALAAPTDMRTIARSGVYGSMMVNSGVGPDRGDLWRASSPVAWFGRSRAATLLVTAADDTLIPWSQATELEAVRRGPGVPAVQALELPPGPLQFVHGTTSAAGAAAYLAAERCLLLRVASPGVPCAAGPSAPPVVAPR
jgi:hypothetical protein